MGDRIDLVIFATIRKRETYLQARGRNAPEHVVVAVATAVAALTVAVSAAAAVGVGVGE